MSELEELPSWAGRSTEDQDGSPSATDPSAFTASAAHQAEKRRRSWKGPVLVLAGILSLLGVGALGYFLADSQGSTETEAAADTTEDDSATADEQLGSEPATPDTDATTTEADAESGTDAGTDTDSGAETDGQEDGQTVTVDVDENAAETSDEDAEASTDGEDTTSDPNESGRSAVFRAGKVYLMGPVPSEEVSQQIESKAAAVVGPDNVVNEYVIDPTSTIEAGSSAPLYVEDVVLFEFNSISVAQPFLPILDLGTLLLRQNPQASITIVTRTDAVGSEEVNLDVATKRAQAVINYWIGKGVNPDQINADPKGEEGASEDDDEETAALNRRAEFIITGLLD